MPHPSRALAAVVVALLPLLMPSRSSAQEAPGDWSRIVRGTQCAPSRPCAPLVGLVWDSTNATPRYPEVLRAVGIGGEVHVAFLVGEDGTVDSSSVTVVRTSQRAFDQHSIEAVRRWRFGVQAPGRPAGAIPVEVRLIYSHEGRCNDSVPLPRLGWAAWNQLVVAICDRWYPG